MGVRYASDQERRLAATSKEVRDLQQRLTAIISDRDDQVADLRAQGLPMRRIAELTGLTDSYLSRISFGRGQPRRAVRG